MSFCWCYDVHCTCLDWWIGDLHRIHLLFIKARSGLSKCCSPPNNICPSRSTREKRWVKNLAINYLNIALIFRRPFRGPQTKCYYQAFFLDFLSIQFQGEAVFLIVYNHQNCQAQRPLSRPLLVNSWTSLRNVKRGPWDRVCNGLAHPPPYHFFWVENW